MGLGALKNISLKKARKCANQWRSVLHDGMTPLKNAINKSVNQCVIFMIKKTLL